MKPSDYFKSQDKLFTMVLDEERYTRTRMRVLIGHEFSGIVREAFRKRGHDAWSCDLLDAEIPGNHYKGDIFHLVKNHRQHPFDFYGFHPVCTYLTNSGIRWLYNTDGSFKLRRWLDLQIAVRDFRRLQKFLSDKKGYIENPIPHKYARDGFNIEGVGLIRGIGKYTQIIQPWQFGHKEIKATCLWLYNLPKLEPTNIVGPPPKDPEEKKRWARVHREPPGPDRWKNRSRTFQGIADAMAEQWG